MRARARDVRRWMMEDDDGLPHFERPSQNIATAAAILQGFLEPATPEEQRAQGHMRCLLEKAAAQ